MECVGQAWPVEPGTLLVSTAFYTVVPAEPPQLGELFVVGLVLGFVRMRSGRLGPAILAHMTFDTVAALLLFTNGW